MKNSMHMLKHFKQHKKYLPLPPLKKKTKKPAFLPRCLVPFTRDIINTTDSFFCVFPPIISRCVNPYLCEGERREGSCIHPQIDISSLLFSLNRITDKIFCIATCKCISFSLRATIKKNEIHLDIDIPQFI